MTADPFFLHIHTQNQQLQVVADNTIIQRYVISTAKNGIGEQKGSECTPQGWHRIRAKIGDQQPLLSVFIGRRPTGEIYSDLLRASHPNRDWILTRILWLDGLEAYKNRYGHVHTASRYIYIHGCPDDLITGKPQSHGCIRMKNVDIIELFNQTPINTKVLIS
jgi:lipoprotein-anchoring transpeptidase ErfK/SrfK